MVWFVCDNGAVLSLLGTDALDFALAALAASAASAASAAASALAGASPPGPPAAISFTHVLTPSKTFGTIDFKISAFTRASSFVSFAGTTTHSGSSSAFSSATYGSRIFPSRVFPSLSSATYDISSSSSYPGIIFPFLLFTYASPSHFVTPVTATRVTTPSPSPSPSPSIACRAHSASNRARAQGRASFSCQCHPWTLVPSARSSTIHRASPSPARAIASRTFAARSGDRAPARGRNSARGSRRARDRRGEGRGKKTRDDESGDRPTARRPARRATDDDARARDAGDDDDDGDDDAGTLDDDGRARARARGAGARVDAEISGRLEVFGDARREDGRGRVSQRAGAADGGRGGVGFGFPGGVPARGAVETTGHISRPEGAEDADAATDAGRPGDARYATTTSRVVTVLTNFLRADEEEEEKERKENPGEPGVSFGFDRRAFATRARANARLTPRFRVAS